MSTPVPHWLRLSNELKARPPEPLLTPSQRGALEELESALAVPQWVNLHGPPGSGKTFVAWAHARRTGARHIPHHRRLESTEAGDWAPGGKNVALLIDNAPVQEQAVRTLLARCALLGVDRVVLISQEPVRMPMRRVALPALAEADWAVVQETVQRCGVATPPSGARSLWEFLRACCEQE